MLESIQQALDLWAGGVKATGGAITPSKSFWWLLDYKWDSKSGVWKFRGVGDMPGELTMVDPTGKRVQLDRMEPAQAQKTLGVMMAPDISDDSAQYAKLAKATSDWSGNVAKGFTLQRDILPMVSTTILKTLQYPMALTTFTVDRWTKLMAPVLRVCLPRAGVCRSFPRVAVYAPLKFQGLGIPHPFGLQVTSHLETLMRHGTNQTQTGKYLAAALEAHQLEIGLPVGLFQQHFSNTGILCSNTWLKQLWSEFESLGIHLAYTGEDLQLRRDGDEFLTQLFIDAEVNQDDLLWLNWCREHLHAVTVSDLVTADGKPISNW